MTTTTTATTTTPLPNLGTVDVNGVTRHFGYYEPDPTTPDPVPLVFAFHGGGGTMAIMARALGFDSVPAARTYYTVLPQGYDPIAQTGASSDGVWNSGQSFMALQDPQDDVAFVDALLVEMAAIAAAQGTRIDQSRTYAVGFSNGGMMTHRLAAERSSGLRRTWSGGDASTEVRLLTMPAVAHEVPDGVMQLIEPFLLSHHK